MGESRPLRSHTGLICLSAGTPGVGHPVPCSLGFLICEKGATVACAHCGVVGVKPEGACLPSLLSSLYPPPTPPCPPLSVVLSEAVVSGWSWRAGYAL